MQNFGKSKVLVNLSRWITSPPHKHNETQVDTKMLYHKIIYSGLSRTLTSAKIEFFVTLVYAWKLLNNVIKNCILYNFAFPITPLTYLYKCSFSTLTDFPYQF